MPLGSVKLLTFFFYYQKVSCVDLSGFGVLFFKLESSMCNVNILKDEPHDVMGKNILYSRRQKAPI